MGKVTVGGLGKSVSIGAWILTALPNSGTTKCLPHDMQALHQATLSGMHPEGESPQPPHTESPSGTERTQGYPLVRLWRIERLRQQRSGGCDSQT